MGFGQQFSQQHQFPPPQAPQFGQQSPPQQAPQFGQQSPPQLATQVSHQSPPSQVEAPPTKRRRIVPRLVQNIIDDTTTGKVELTEDMRKQIRGLCAAKLCPECFAS